MIKGNLFSLRGTGMKILIVDDDYSLANLIQLILEEEGYEVRSAGNGQEGYSAYLHFKPDVVITDLHMPEKNGLELMESIRRLDPKVKTIYMSGDPWMFRRRLEEEKTGHAASLLQKPFSKGELMRLLAKAAD